MPPEALAYKMQDPQWCLKQAEQIGPGCHRLIRSLFSHKYSTICVPPKGHQPGEKVRPVRLEAACIRALHYDNVKYRTVKSILHQGLDQMPLPGHSNVIPLSSPYTGSARFLRNHRKKGRRS